MIGRSLLCIIAPTFAQADMLPAMVCSGSAPDWGLAIEDDTADLDFQRQSEMTIPHQTNAEGREWPKALTLISRTDTAIVIINQQTCGAASYTAQVLTQRGQTPILLVGCCTALQ